MDSGIKRIFERFDSINESSDFMGTGYSVLELGFQRFMLAKELEMEEVFLPLLYHKGIDPQNARDTITEWYDRPELKQYEDTLDQMIEGEFLPGLTSYSQIDPVIRLEGKNQDMIRLYHSVGIGASVQEQIDGVENVIQNGLTAQGESQGGVGTRVFTRVRERHNEYTPWVVVDVARGETEAGKSGTVRQGHIITLVASVSPDRIVGVNGLPINQVRSAMKDFKANKDDMLNYLSEWS